eukprot:jgi/Chlat1/3662/Chrsp24S00278
MAVPESSQALKCESLPTGGSSSQRTPERAASQPIAIGNTPYKGSAGRPKAIDQPDIEELDCTGRSWVARAAYWDDGGEVEDAYKLQMLGTQADDAEIQLTADVAEALDWAERTRERYSNNADEFAELSFSERAAAERRQLQHSVATQLAEMGYYVAICHTRFGNGTHHHGGSHEFIEVYQDDGSSYYSSDRCMIVDVYLKEQFEIARPTLEYTTTLCRLPRTFSGWPSRLCSMVEVMCSSMTRSLGQSGMHCPPWRSREYMLSKWFATCRTREEVSIFGTFSSDYDSGLEDEHAEALDCDYHDSMAPVQQLVVA